jgi:hypothetical protein
MLEPPVFPPPDETDPTGLGGLKGACTLFLGLDARLLGPIAADDPAAT